MVNLSKIKYSRAFIIGNVNGDYQKLIDILYEQKFSSNDILIATGDFIQSDNLKSIDTLLFFMNNENTIGLLGKNEYDLLYLLQEEKINQLPLWVKNYPNIEEISQYLIDLPAIVQLNKNHYIVNRGIEPIRGIKSQNPEVFYTITDYDKDSRFYQFENPEEKSWYMFEHQNKIIFSGLDAGNVEIPAGYCLYSDAEKDKPLKCLIYDKNTESFIIVESIGNLLNGKKAAYGFGDEETQNMTNELMKNLENVKNMKENINFNPAKYTDIANKAKNIKPPKITQKSLQKDMNNILNNAGTNIGVPKVTRKKTPYDSNTSYFKDKKTQDILDEAKKDINRIPKIKEKNRYMIDEGFISPEQQKVLDEAKKDIPQATPDTSEIKEITPEIIAPIEDIQEVDVGEGPKKEVIVKDNNNEPAKFYHYQIPSNYISAGGSNVDISIATFAVYKSFGFTSAVWQLNEKHKEYDICDELAKGGTWSIDEIINSAVSFNGHVPAAIFTHSHPNCVCRFVLSKPTSVDQIPDNAPGVPMNVSEEVLLKFKQNLFDYINSQPNPIIYARTIAPTSKYVHAFIMRELDRTKTASKDNWIEDIKPMQIIESTIVDTGYGTRLPMDKGDIGFILKHTDEKAKIYSYHYHGLFTIPMKAIRILDLKKTDSEPKKGKFVLTEDDMLGLLYKIDAEDNIIVYLPEIDSTIKINKIQMLEHN